MFVFYDTETTGLDKTFSQILQIALVFTDDDLNIISLKKLECRPSAWVVPSPGALLITGFEPADLKKSEYSHFEMMKEVNDWLRGQHWPVTFVGYNSSGFDEPLLAQNLHQNLLDPTLTSSKNDTNGQTNGRADVMTMVRAVALYMPGVLKLDILNDIGTPSVSLKNVAQQNGIALADEDAHDAMNDIKATVGVARLIQKAAPQIWNQMMALSTVEGVDAFLQKNEVFAYTKTIAFGKQQTAVIMTSLAEREGSTTQTLFDLRADPAPYLKMTVEELKDVFLLKEKDRPFVLMRKNSQPVLMPMELAETVVSEKDDPALYTARAKAIHADKGFLERVAKASLLAKQSQPVLVPTLPETMIDKEISLLAKGPLNAWMEAFHMAENWRDAAALLEDYDTRFKDELVKDPALSRFAKFAERIVFEHAPEELSMEKQEALKKHIAGLVLNPDLKAPYMTVARARRELESIERERAEGRKKWDGVDDSKIRCLKLYYTSIEKEYAAYAPAQPPANDNTPQQPKAKKSLNNNIKPN